MLALSWLARANGDDRLCINTLVGEKGNLFEDPKKFLLVGKLITPLSEFNELAGKMNSM